MTHNTVHGETLENRIWRQVLPAAILLAGALCTWWLAVQADRDLRETLLRQARLVAGAVNIEHIRAITGTDADLDSPAYLRLKDQLGAVRAAAPQCRFVYLMGRKADGTVFFHVDVQDEAREETPPSQPGDIYNDASEELIEIFDSGTPFVEGPLPDEWGTWVSALVPLADPQTGEILAILGMDIDARDWKWNVAARVALPVGLMLVLIIGLMAALLASGRAAASPRPVLWRLLPVMAVLLALLFATGGTLMWQQQRERLSEKTELAGVEAMQNLQRNLEQQTQWLSATVQPIATNARVRQALRSGDAERMLSDWRGLYETLHREHALTHFNFISSERVLLLRMQQVELRGDRIDRFTAIEAERTGKTAWGLEMGRVGALALRVVQPVFDEQTLLGYVELGKELDEVVKMASPIPGMELAVLQYKETLDRETWEAGMRTLGREADWNRLAHSVIIYSSRGYLSDALAPSPRHVHGQSDDGEITTDGKVWRVVASPIEDASGREIGCLLVMTDITPMKAAFKRTMALGGTVGAVLLAALLALVFVVLRRTDASILAQQAELRASEEKFRHITEGIGDVVWLCSRDNTEILYISPSYEKVWGRTCESLYADHRWFMESVHPADRDAVYSAFRNYTSTGRLNMEYRILKPDGDLSWVQVRAYPIVDADGEVLHHAGIATDITGRKQAETEREKLQSQLLQSQKMESVGILAGGVAHDFNNMLHTMRGNIELLARSESLDARSATRLQTVIKSMDRAAKLVQQLLLFSRKAKSSKVLLDLSHEVREMARMLERTIPKMIAPELRLDPIAQPVSGDPVQIEQVLLNLANNAVDAMPEGGRLIFETSNVELNQEFVRLHPGSATGRHVLLTVSDTGCGMDEATLKQVFEPFFTTKEVGKGTGLGLASVYGIVKAHGGYIHCYSEPGRGTTFRIYLPAAEQSEVARAEPEPEAAPRGGSETILVVDDEPEIRELTRYALEDLGYTVISAAGGEDALKIYRERGRSIDLVLLDLNMPGMGGHKCLEELLQVDPAVRVVISSGYSANGRAGNVPSSGARGFIGKPYQLKELDATVRKVLE